MPAPFPIEFTVASTPVSLQGSTLGKNAWKALVAAAATNACPAGFLPGLPPLSVTIYYFSDAPMEGDVDNIIKPILDAMCGIAFSDDKCVVSVRVRKIEPNQPVQVSSPSRVLLAALTGKKPIVYVKLSDDPHGDLL